MKYNEGIVVRENAELNNVDHTMKADEEGCTARLHGSQKILYVGVIFISQIAWW